MSSCIMIFYQVFMFPTLYKPSKENFASHDITHDLRNPPTFHKWTLQSRVYSL